MFGLTDTAAVTLVGFASGLVLGLASRIPRFCTLGAIEDALYGGNRDRIMMWPMAIGTAVAVTALLSAFGLAAVEGSVYLRFEFSLSASLAGGLMFGVGMALAGNCGFGALARIGGGDIRSALIVLTIGIAAYSTAVGPLAEMRNALFPREHAASLSDSSLAVLLEEVTSIPELYISLAVALLLVAPALTDPHFVRNRSAVLWSVLIGLSCTAAWFGTTYVAQTGFDPIPVESHSFTMPLGEILLQAMGVNSLGGFSVGSVLGVVAGAWLGARIRHQFRWEACDDPGELRRQIFGAALMGVGGVIALGCSVGQGLSAFSALAISAPVTILAILVGAVLGLRYLVEGRNPFESLSAILPRLFGKRPRSH
ncbi:YeeE/YedE family protein [Nisaea acidiphila]|uniref:YeeE/YedE family protein n=1 Tax=Nisaea acidiphila TaxID=1862145 RepID=A0A9J7AW19_9PROT|nr:YeeE/YedE family protein [Nisaea acidiphila]UUX51551.1 YeeE/YedE family protein [Nisaea acidiphila]